MTRRTRLLSVLALNFILIAGLVVVGITAHSLGVLAAGGDYLADSGAIILALLAICLGSRPPTAKRPEGYPRATAYAALVNAILLGLVVVVVIVTAVSRLVTGAGYVYGLPVLVISLIAATAMGVGVLILGGDSDEDGDSDADRANMRVVLLDTAADAFAAAGVAVTGAIILATNGWYWLDPAVALLIAVVIGYHVIVLLRQVAGTLRGHEPVSPTRT